MQIDEPPIATMCSGCARPPCRLDGCDKPRTQQRTVCSMHATRWAKHGTFDPPPAIVPTVCPVDGCDRLGRSRGSLCGLHDKRMRTHGTTERVVRTVDRAALMWAKIDVGDCWLFTGFRNVEGYGQFWDGCRVVPAHRWVWEHLVGPIPEGLEIDHLCKQRACCNPDHLQPVTPKVNTHRSAAFSAKHAKATHCPEGHPYSGYNLIVRMRRQGPARICRICNNKHQRAYRARRRASNVDS